MRNLFRAVLLLALVCPLAAEESAANPEGVWSAPSLSNPAVPIVVALLPGGKATERIGDFRGTGTWQSEGGAARILWDSGWVGLLRPTMKGGWELLTWKKESPRAGPPDDRQPATRE